MSWAALVAHELRLEARGRETLVPTLLTALLVALVGALGLHDAGEAHAFAGALWMGVAFSGAVGMARAFGAERDRGTLDTLLTLPAARGAVFLGKAVAQALVLLASALVVAAVLLAATGAAPASSWPALARLLVLGAAGLGAVGTLLSAIAARTRGRELMLPVLLLPLAVPVLVATTHASTDVVAGEPFGAWRGELLVLLGYDVAFPAACVLLFDAAVGP